MLTFTLISDGSSDRVLIPIIRWCIRAHRPALPIDAYFADFRPLRNPPNGLSERIATAIDLYPCDLLIIHRDAERESITTRKQEIQIAFQHAALPNETPYLCVIPIRMQEAWLLFNIEAIRRASGNPNGLTALPLPTLRDLEGIPNPKDTLHTLLKTASGLRGRRLKDFTPNRAAYLVADNIDDFSPLRMLSAFNEFEQDVQTFLAMKFPNGNAH